MHAACLPSAHPATLPHPSAPAPRRQVDDAEWQRLSGADLSSASSTAGLALPERWIVSALHRTVADITAAHER